MRLTSKYRPSRRLHPYDELRTRTASPPQRTPTKPVVAPGGRAGDHGTDGRGPLGATDLRAQPERSADPRPAHPATAQVRPAKQTRSRPNGSGAEPLDHPRASVTAVPQAIVEPVRLVLPELDGVGADPVAAPERGQRHVAVGVARREPLQPLLEHRSARDHLALRRGPGAQPAAERAGTEIRLGLLAADPLDAALDAHLALQGGPPEHQRRRGVRAELAGLAAPVIGVEHEAALVEALEQDHPCG